MSVKMNVADSGNARAEPEALTALSRGVDGSRRMQQEAIRDTSSPQELQRPATKDFHAFADTGDVLRD